MAVQVTVRLGILVVSLLAASVLVFAVVNVLPGDPATVVLGTNATPQSLHALRQQMGLDQPAWERYLAWLGGLLHGDFGVSLLSRSPVGPDILEKLGVSGPLALLASALALAVALPLGVLAGVRYRRLSGSLISALSLAGIAIPAFWFGVLLVTVFAIRLHLLPAGGFVPWSEDPLAALPRPAERRRGVREPP